METTDCDGAAEQLNLIAQARGAAAERFVTPIWYHPLLALALAAHLVVFTLGGGFVRLVATLGLLAAVLALMVVYRRLAGVWISSYHAGRAGRWSYAMAGVVGGALIASMTVYDRTGLVWPPFVFALVVAVAVVVFGRRFDEALRRRLRLG